MTENQTSSMIRFAATNTDDRKRKIMDSVQRSNFGGSPFLREFGFSVGNQFERLEARVLEPPMLGYGAQKQVIG